MPCHTDGELVGGDDLVAQEVGDGHLCRRDQVKVHLLDMVHLPFLIRELPGTDARSLIDDDGRLDFLKASSNGLIEKEVNEGTLQAGTLLFVYRETCPCYLHTQLKVDDVIVLDELPVRLGTLSKLWLLAMLQYHLIVLCRAAFGY